MQQCKEMEIESKGSDKQTKHTERQQQRQEERDRNIERAKGTR